MFNNLIGGKEMKANELMIGDWVQHQNHDVVGKVIFINTQPDLMHYQHKSATIQAVYPTGNMLCHCKVSLFEPIPLTTEILEKSGFEPIRQDAGEPYYWQFFDKEEGHVINAFRRIYRGLWIECSNAITETSVNKQCEYVHELQHALRLAGIEKEIIL